MRVIPNTNGKYSITVDGIVLNDKGKEIVPNNGTVTLYCNNERRNVRVNRLMQQIYNDKIEIDEHLPGDNIIHLDGNKDNSSIDNLLLTGIRPHKSDTIYRLYNGQYLYLASTVEEMATKIKLPYTTTYKLLHGEIDKAGPYRR